VGFPREGAGGEDYLEPLDIDGSIKAARRKQAN